MPERHEGRGKGGPKGLKLEVRALRAPRLLVLDITREKNLPLMKSLRVSSDQIKCQEIVSIDKGKSNKILPFTKRYFSKFNIAFLHRKSEVNSSFTTCIQYIFVHVFFQPRKFIEIKISIILINIASGR